MTSPRKETDKYGFIRAATAAKKKENLLQENARVEKWSKMLGAWERYSVHKSKKLKSRIRKGVPSCFRGRVWYLLSGADAIRENYPENYYASLLNLEIQKNVEVEIGLDLNRTYPNHIKFRVAEGKESLFRVLRAYAVMDPEVSYTQGMSFIVAMFLLFLSEEDCFWLFVTLLTQYDFREFFVNGMPKVYNCFYVANGVLRHFLPQVFKSFQKNSLSISMYATQWFMTGFTSNFTIESSLRIWDCFFSEGIKVFYRVFLSVLQIHSKVLSTCSFEKAMEIFRSIGDLDTDKVLEKAFRFSLSLSLISRLDSDYKSNPKKKYVDWVTARH